jgi:hypothetical protein
MSRSKAQVAAIDAVEPSGVHALSVAQLRAERHQLTARLGLGPTRPVGGRRGTPAQRGRLGQAQRDRALRAAREAEEAARVAQTHADRYTGLRAVLNPTAARQARAQAAHPTRLALAARERPASDRQRLVEVTRELGWRKQASRTALALQQPAWLVGALGHYPAAGTSHQRRDRQTAADAIRTYRDTYNIRDPTPNVPSRRPDRPPQRAAWRRVTEAVDRVRARDRAGQAPRAGLGRQDPSGLVGALERDTG